MRTDYQPQLPSANSISEILLATAAPDGLSPRPRACYYHPQRSVTLGPVSLAISNSMIRGKMMQKWPSFPQKEIVVVSLELSHLEATDPITTATRPEQSKHGHLQPTPTFRCER